ncbi:hypothetical protein [Amycolatopsis taiwanensis]|uniref:hypothetical protein n=1 Tax=Amycolatopsis taiwanensis TaxID=342230 RepID=UPI00048146C0|nr:hypothetical protein [Amycolatopsis taiwanensis]
MPTTDILLYLAIAILVVWRVIIRQFRGSAPTVRGLTVIPGLLVIVGAVSCAPLLPKASGAELGLLATDLALLIAFGVARAASTRLTERNGYAFQKGTAATLVLWLATIAIRVGVALVGVQLGVAGPLTSASLLLSMGLTIGTQNAVVYLRAQRLGLRIAPDRATPVRS